MPFIGASALAIATIRPGTRGVGRRHEHVVDAERDHLDPGRVDAEVGDDVALGADSETA